MKRITLIIVLLSSLYAVVFYPWRNGMCTDNTCCERCKIRYTSCREAYEKRLYSNCHSSCGSLYPRNSQEYNSCLDECYDDAAAEVESGGDGICEDQYEGCKGGCGGCPGEDGGE